jgi:hypothetical protein
VTVPSSTRCWPAQCWRRAIAPHHGQGIASAWTTTVRPSQCAGARSTSACSTASEYVVLGVGLLQTRPPMPTTSPTLSRLRSSAARSGRCRSISSAFLLPLILPIAPAWSPIAPAWSGTTPRTTVRTLSALCHAPVNAAPWRLTVCYDGREAGGVAAR